jgi:hypothetical protein
MHSHHSIASFLSSETTRDVWRALKWVPIIIDLVDIIAAPLSEWGGENPETSDSFTKIKAGKGTLYLRLPKDSPRIHKKSTSRIEKSMLSGTPDDWFQQFIDWLIGHLFPNAVHGDLSRMAKNGSREFYRPPE